MLERALLVILRRRTLLAAGGSLLTLGACKASSAGDSPAPPAATAPTAAAAAAHASGYRVGPVGETHAVLVHVQFVGTRRAAPWEIPPMVRTQCSGAEEALDEALVVGSDGGVSDAVVWIDDIHSGASLDSAPSAIQDEKRCAFEPHVLAVPASGSLRLTNSDPANHAVRFEFAGDDTRDDFTKTLPAGALLGLPVRPEWAGRYARITCPIHLWMWSYVHFFEHPYFAVTQGGMAKISGVPAGRYHVTVWHEGISVTYASSLKFPPPVTARAEAIVEHGDARLDFIIGDDGKLALK